MKLALMKPSDHRQPGLLDSDLASFLEVKTKQLNQAAVRSMHILRRDDVRYQMSAAEWHSFRAGREKRIGQGGRQYRPYVYTFEGVCAVIARLRLNLSDVKKQALLSLFGRRKFPIIDYGHRRQEETVTHCLKRAFRGIVTVRLHFPVRTASARYFVDAYLVEARLAIEMDERHHRGRLESDRQRQMEIEKALNCQFLRIKEDADFVTVINEVLRRIAPDYWRIGEVAQRHTSLSRW